MTTLRNVVVNGRARLAVRLEGGRIAAIGHRLTPDADEIDGCGGALIPGLVDHHIHLFALAAEAHSVNVADVRGANDLAVLIASAAAGRPAGAWIRAVGYHERIAGELTRTDLDRLAPRHPLRLQHQTGALWVLNTAGLDAVLAGAPPPGSVELGADGQPTGRVWRGDDWLKTRLPPETPPLAPVGARLAALGITAVTDASVTTDADAAAQLADAHRAGDLPQRLTLMSGGALDAPADGAFAVGPVKVLLDDHALIDLDDFAERIARARAWGRNVATHCVTAGELALTLAALESAGAEPGDRIEHGGVIPAEAIAQIKALGLSVVTQSAFVRERGDRYLAEVDPAEQPDLYRCASLLAAGVPVAASSDAPYAAPDPWAAMATAMDRRTAGGAVLGGGERVSGQTALAMALGEMPGGPVRRIAVGAPGDLCLLNAPLAESLEAPDASGVRATLIGGKLVHGS